MGLNGLGYASEFLTTKANSKILMVTSPARIGLNEWVE